MIMNDIILNERSLQGQYSSMEEFIALLPEFLKCVRYFMEQDDWEVLKKSDLFLAPVTEEEALFKIRGNRSDAARKIKRILCQMSDEPPYWDIEARQSGSYFDEDVEVSGTSVAEASARTGFVLSFPKSYDADQELMIMHEDEKLRVSSITFPQYRIRCLYHRGFSDIYTYLKECYHGTRLNFEEFDPEYGFEDFEMSEIAECLETFERFAGHESWRDVLQDSALRYKEYQSSKKNNWFRGTVYEQRRIDKFRCGNPKRCFGYRKDDIFYVLRMERDHSISDYG